MRGGFPERPPWDAAPVGVRRAVEAALGQRVAGAETVHGGMAPGPASLLTLTDGRVVFAKAVSEVYAKAHRLYSQELGVLRLLPDTVPHAPLVTGLARDGWVVVVTEAADGAAVGPPWRSQHVATATDAVALSSAHRAPDGLVPVLDRLPRLDGWERLATERADTLDAWERSRIGRLVALADGWHAWTSGAHLVHLDVRCDNIVPRADGVWLVDWSSASRGAAWVDPALLALDLVASGHVGGAAVATSAARGLLSRLPYEATRLVVAVAGMFRHNALRPDPPGAPPLRAWQHRRAVALRPLLEALVGR